jgi:hypothetical protein
MIDKAAVTAKYDAFKYAAKARKNSMGTWLKSQVD